MNVNDLLYDGPIHDADLTHMFARHAEAMRVVVAANHVTDHAEHVWLCEFGESKPSDFARAHGACRACVLAAAALAVNRESRPVIAYIPTCPDPEIDKPLVIELTHLTAFYNIMRDRHGLPFLLHDEDRIYGRSWS